MSAERERWRERKWSSLAMDCCCRCCSLCRTCRYRRRCCHELSRSSHFFSSFCLCSKPRDSVKVGYVVCSQQTMNRYGNRRFQTMATEFMEDNILHAIVGEMHSELLEIGPDKSVYREFESDRNRMSLSASLVRPQPPLSLFVLQVTPRSKMAPPPPPPPPS